MMWSVISCFLRIFVLSVTPAGLQEVLHSAVTVLKKLKHDLALATLREKDLDNAGKAVECHLRHFYCLAIS